METSRNGQPPEMTAGQKALRGYHVFKRFGISLEQAAEMVGGTSARQIESVKGVLRRDPSLEASLASGEMTLNAAQVAAGYRQHKPVSERVMYGKGDRFVEAANAMSQYLSAWRGREFKFTHVPPREAAKRVKVIDEMIEGLQEARADLVARSVRAQLSMPSH